MHSRDIRERFLHFFEDRGHQRLSSSPLVPRDDPALLFTVAGMIPLKQYFLGARTPPAPSVTSCQKCFRMDDIEEVGRTPRHETFFEMLGNFSFGAYFKEGAIPLAWELLTHDLGLPAERLWPSVHPRDDLALELWTRAGVPERRVARLEDNFWEMGKGLPGPCGFDSEIHWDLGAPCSCGRTDCLPGCDGDRWVELWNLVFMEFDRDASGQMRPLPRPCIDTGMGLERLACVLQGKTSIFDTDLFAPLTAGLERRSALDPGERERLVSLRVCADHLRGSVFLIGDGVAPANEGRGYVLRRLVRRAALHARRLGLQGGLSPGVSDVVEVMGQAYPELVEQRQLVQDTLAAEESAFQRVLEAGVERLEELLSGAAEISGEEAFRLHDTFGLPIELTEEMAAERGVRVDRKGFDGAMTAQRERSRRGAGVQPGATASTASANLELLPITAFVGYDTLETPATVVRVGFTAGRSELGEGEEGDALLEPSPFYAEAGGQVGDTGALSWPEGRAAVLDTTYIPATDVRVHRVHVEHGRLSEGSVVLATVDAARRARVARHHSATHLLHTALREVLGPSAVQRGSYVGPDHTTFDFAFNRALAPDEIAEVEHRVNAAIRDNLGRAVELLPIEEARATGAVALFGEKYGDTVRVVDFGGWARELCGGTHVQRSGDIGAAIILGVESIGQGVRRVEMVAGDAAEHRWREAAGALQRAARALRARPDEVPQRVENLQEQVRRLSRELEQVQRAGPAAGLGEATVEDVRQLRFAHLMAPAGTGGKTVAGLADRLFAETLRGDGVALVLSDTAFAVKVGSTALAAGVDAGQLARAAAEATGGRGGGRRDFAQGGIGDASSREQALRAVRHRLEVSSLPSGAPV